MSLFEFQLASLRSIEPWGTAPNRTLHWFGLSDGTYHIELGPTRLLEYAARKGWPRFVEYNVARIHEDILAMLPNVLESIPNSVTRYFVNGELGKTLGHLQRTWETLPDGDNILDVAILALERRLLDTGYLNPSARIWIWSHGTKTVIEWDNRDRVVDGKPAWASAYGRYEMEREQFFEEVKSFHTRFVAAMDERVRKVCLNWNRQDVEIDLKRLAEEQAERCGSFDMAVECSRPNTNWQLVEKAFLNAGIGSSA